MEFFPSTLKPEESNAAADRWQSQIAERGWGLWAVEVLSSQQFIGFIGLQVPAAPLPFSPCVEVGWRLAYAHWGKGYATEGARAALRVGFEQLQLAEIVSFTAVNNVKSRAVMERLHMRKSNTTFEHPSVPEGSPLRTHCLYWLTCEQWREQSAGQ
jgi:RimJ/RimL family protein N-acetyltransferase